MDEGESSRRVAREEDGESERRSDACNCGQAFQDMAEKVRRERHDMFGLTPGWSTMTTASNSQTSVSDNNLVETSFENNGGVEPVEETGPGRSRSRAPHL